MKHHKSLHKSSQNYVTRTAGAASTWKTFTVTATTNNFILFNVTNTVYTCQADVDTKMTVCMFVCLTQSGEMCTIGTSTCLFCKEAPRCMKV